MAKNSGSVGGRRGGKCEDEMSLSEAKAASTKNGGGKPNLNSKPAASSKVTNKPSMSGKRMK